MLKSRWARLEAIFKHLSRLSVQEMKPSYCNFFMLVSLGACLPIPKFQLMCLSIVLSFKVIGYIFRKSLNPSFWFHHMIVGVCMITCYLTCYERMLTKLSVLLQSKHSIEGMNIDRVCCNIL